MGDAHDGRAAPAAIAFPANTVPARMFAPAVLIEVAQNSRRNCDHSKVHMSFRVAPRLSDNAKPDRSRVMEITSICFSLPSPDRRMRAADLGPAPQPKGLCDAPVTFEDIS
ncbi:hypothetical protein [Novosphingobium sp. PhB165]|uniref:hypothetical protein n=1 Tax=Novosphingobium sp. PhB165 TaxID=2485105 RepID=UPI001048037F|nr:hypothetical protein [Novosphingobium sp. PhB165]